MYFYAQKTELILSSFLNYDALSSSESSARDPEKSQVNNAVKEPTNVNNASNACDGKKNFMSVGDGHIEMKDGRNEG